MDKLIHNSSMPRSGSELLQVILHQNPAIYGSPTSPLLEYQYGMRSNTGLSEVAAQPKDLMTKAFIGACQGVANGYYEAITDRPIVCDKNRGWAANYHWLKQWNPDPKIIVMTRDIRGIIASMERIYRKNVHTPECAALPLQLDRRIGAWLNVDAQTMQGNPNVGAAPVGLALNRIHGLSQDGTSDKVLFVKYEDLCSAPEATLSRIYAYLKLDEFKHDFSNIKKEVVEDTARFGVFGDHNVKGGITAPAGWDDVLPTTIADSIRSNFDWYYAPLGY